MPHAKDKKEEDRIDCHRHDDRNKWDHFEIDATRSNFQIISIAQNWRHSHSHDGVHAVVITQRDIVTGKTD